MLNSGEGKIKYSILFYSILYGVGDPMLEQNITSPYLIANSEVQLSTSTTKNIRQKFPLLLRNGTTNRERKTTRKGEERGES